MNTCSQKTHKFIKLYKYQFFPFIHRNCKLISFGWVVKKIVSIDILYTSYCLVTIIKFAKFYKIFKKRKKNCNGGKYSMFAYAIMKKLKFHENQGTRGLECINLFNDFENNKPRRAKSFFFCLIKLMAKNH